MAERKQPRQDRSRQGRPAEQGGGYARPPRRPGVSADDLLEMADDLEEQARDLLRTAKQLQRMAQALEHGDRGDASERGAGGRPFRGGRPAGGRFGGPARRPAESGEGGGEGRPPRREGGAQKRFEGGAKRRGGEAPSWTPPGKKRRS